jgi:MFS family permease
MQGWLSAVWGVAAIAGPTLGAFIVQHLHWAYVFWIEARLVARQMLRLEGFMAEPEGLSLAPDCLVRLAQSRVEAKAQHQIAGKVRAKKSTNGARA